MGEGEQAQSTGVARKVYNVGLILSIATVPIFFGIIGSAVLAVNYCCFRGAESDEDYAFAKKSFNCALIPVFILVILIALVIMADVAVIILTSTIPEWFKF